MKKIIFSAIIIALVTVSCNNNPKKETTTTTSKTIDSATTITDSTSIDTTETAEVLYACPMHPEVHGKLNATCSKCGMKLTEPVPVKTK